MARLSFDKAETLAQKFRIDHGIGLSDAIDPLGVLRKLNIFVMFRPLSERFYGMSLQSKSGAKFMLINSNNAIGRQHFSIAHELYHLFYDETPKPHICKANEKGKTPSEYDADVFASALLIPKQGLLEFIPTNEIKSKNISLATILRTEQYFRVSHTALLVRLKACKLISEKDYEKLSVNAIQETAKEYGHNTALYRKGNTNVVIGDFGEKARLSYEKEIISEGHYLELLNLLNDDQD